MPIPNALNWIGLTCWVLAAIGVAIVGSKYQIKEGYIRSLFIELNKKDKRLIINSAILFFVGIIFFIVGAVL